MWKDPSFNLCFHLLAYQFWKVSEEIKLLTISKYFLLKFAQISDLTKWTCKSKLAFKTLNEFKLQVSLIGCEMKMMSHHSFILVSLVINLKVKTCSDVYSLLHLAKTLSFELVLIFFSFFGRGKVKASSKTPYACICYCKFNNNPL